MSTAEEFMALFRGNPDASYDYSPKRGDKYAAVEHGLTLEDITRHLAGKLPSVLSIPIKPDGLVHFAAGDCDRHEPDDPAVDYVAVANKITSLHLPLIVTRSKSPKSAHIWLFFKDENGFDAATARRLIEHYMAVLEIGGKIEVFPKQETLKMVKNEDTGEMELKKGNGINLPLFGGERIAYGEDGEILDAEGFVALALKRKSFGRILADHDLVGQSGHSATSDYRGKHAPMPVVAIRKVHQKHLKELEATNTVGGWDNQLNKTSFYAGQAFAAGALEGTDHDIKSAIRTAAAARQWRDEKIVDDKLSRVWDEGVLEPLEILVDEFPEATKCLEEFNEKFYVVEHLGGKVRVCWEVMDSATGSLTLVHQSFEDFKNRFMHQQILVGQTEKSTGKGEKKETSTRPQYQSKGDFWLHAEERRQFDHVGYAPGQDLGPNVRNLWRGFAVDAEKGKIEKYLEHVFENICKGNQEKYDWLMRWFAWKVRHPGEKSYTCPVLTGPEGIGKNIAVDAFAYLWGAHAFAVTKKEHVTGKFNFHLLACSVLVANEAFFAGDKGQESTLKGLITDDTFILEGKGLNAVPSRNLMSIIVISNEAWAVPAGISARRFTVLDCGEAKRNDTEYFGQIMDELRGLFESRQGYKALLWHLQKEVKLKEFDPRSIVRTEALANQQAESLRGAEALWHDVLFRGQLPGGIEGNRVQSERLLTWARLQRNPNYTRITDKQIGQTLGRSESGVIRGMGFDHARPRPIVHGKQVHAWQIPSLRNARAMWDEKRFPENWPDVHPFQGVLAGRAEADEDDWVLVLVGDEPRTVIHENATKPESEPRPEPNQDADTVNESDLPGKNQPF